MAYRNFIISIIIKKKFIFNKKFYYDNQAKNKIFIYNMVYGGSKPKIYEVLNMFIDWLNNRYYQNFIEDKNSLKKREKKVLDLIKKIGPWCEW